MVERTFELPDLGEGIAEGELVSWLVAAGDTVEEDQVIAEVETDKALVEIPSPYDGSVTRLHHDEGEIVPVDAVIATFEVEGDEEAAAERDSSSPSVDAGGGTGETAADAADTDAAAAGTPADAAADASPGESPVPSGRVFASPSTRTLARELGVDIGAVEGSGPGGRVTGADVRAYAQGASEDAPTGEEPAAGAATASAAAAETAATTTADPEEVAAVGNGTAEAVEQRGSGVGGAAAERDRTLAMPATRQLAADLGVDLNAVPASEEREGEPFVTPDDVRAFAAEGSDGASGVASGVAGATTTEEAKSATEPVTTADERAATETPGEGAAAGDLADRPGERVPYRGVRRTIGEQMAESKYTAPHVSHHDEFDAAELVELQEELAAVAEAEGVKLTYLPFVVKAITTALAEFPYLNASLDESAEEIVLHDEYNVGIAVATDAGLMVPVVKNADEKGLKQLAEEIRDLAERARNRQIKPEEMQGGTFTITNIGVIGGEFSSPIINHPEAAIFAMGPIKKRPWVLDDEVVARNTMRFSMSVDHRLVDGADAARFSNRVKELLAEPSRLLLE